MTPCATCGAKRRRVNGTVRHYGSFEACRRLERYRGLAMDLVAHFRRRAGWCLLCNAERVDPTTHQTHKSGCLVARAEFALQADREGGR